MADWEKARWASMMIVILSAGFFMGGRSRPSLSEALFNAPKNSHTIIFVGVALIGFVVICIANYKQKLALKNEKEKLEENL